VNTTLSVSGSSIYRNTAPTGGGLYVGSSGTSGTVQTKRAPWTTSGPRLPRNCPASAPRLSYTSNTIVASGTTIIYTGVCKPPGSLTVAGLNALPSGRARGNTGNLSLATVRSSPTSR